MAHKCNLCTAPTVAGQELCDECREGSVELSPNEVKLFDLLKKMTPEARKAFVERACREIGNEG